MSNYQHLVNTHEIGNWIDTILADPFDPKLCEVLGVSQNEGETPAAAISRFMHSEYKGSELR